MGGWDFSRPARTGRAAWDAGGEASANDAIAGAAAATSTARAPGETGNAARARRLGFASALNSSGPGALLAPLREAAAQQNAALQPPDAADILMKAEAKGRVLKARMGARKSSFLGGYVGQGPDAGGGGTL